MGSGAQWRDDMAIVRGLGLVPVGAEGAVSSVLMQLSSLLPLAGRHLRAALVSALALSVAAHIVYRLARATLEASGWTPRLTPPLALVAALGAGLGMTWQLEGTIAGGATLAAALALGALLTRPGAKRRMYGTRPRVGDARVWVGYGGLVALAASESHAAGLAVAAALGVQVLVLGDVPPRKHGLLMAAGFAAVSLACLTPMLARPFSAQAGPHLGFDPGTAGVASIDHAAERVGALAAWSTDVGVVSLALAAWGTVWGLWKPRMRWLVAPLVTFVAADAVFPAAALGGGVVAADPLASVRLLAVASLAILAALGVHASVLNLARSRIPFARPAAALLVAFSFTLVLMTAEQSSHVADRRQQHGAEVWTDEALGALPHRAVLLVRSPEAAWRLWAARVVRGERPDVTVVPMPLIDRGNVAFRLLEQEQNLAPLVRDVAVSGQPGEYALSTLADARPVYVELNPTWDRRLFAHLTPEPQWLSFAPTALGRSDREKALKRARTSFDRVWEAARRPPPVDQATSSVLRARTHEQAMVLATLGDREGLALVLTDLEGLDPNDPFVKTLRERMEAKKRGRIDVANLMR